MILKNLSNALKPRLYTLDGTSLADAEYPKTIIGVCSPHGDLNTTAVFVEFGNPGDVPSIYSGVRTGISLENHLIYRPPLVFNNKEVHPSLRTIYTGNFSKILKQIIQGLSVDNKWLNEPQFVFSYEANQYVYFFFREIATETDQIGRNIYSRVARVCKVFVSVETGLIRCLERSGRQERIETSLEFVCQSAFELLNFVAGSVPFQLPSIGQFGSNKHRNLLLFHIHFVRASVPVVGCLCF